MSRTLILLIAAAAVAYVAAMAAAWQSSAEPPESECTQWSVRVQSMGDPARKPPADLVSEAKWEPFSSAMVVEPVRGKVAEVALRAYVFSRSCTAWKEDGR